MSVLLRDLIFYCVTYYEKFYCDTMISLPLNADLPYSVISWVYYCVFY